MRVYHVGFLVVGIGMAMMGILGGSISIGVLASSAQSGQLTGSAIIGAIIGFGFLCIGAKIVHSNLVVKKPGQ
ncbi:MAG: hypothetical protein KTR15_08795 [Phycisphaeraceae bacterium]|nr:hypothetical protein [Phycisphaeraceae bacterium]